MSYRHTIQAGLESLHEVEQLLNEFKLQGEIPVIELDLILQKIRNFYEIMLLLKQQQNEALLQQQKIQIHASGNESEQALNKDQITENQSVTTNANKAKPEKEAGILSEKFSGRSSLYDSIHDTVSKRDGEPIGQTKPVTSIKSAIGINDRFTFVRELFNNDAAGFENTIKILDEATNFNEAYNYMIQHFDWDMDSETVQQLLDIIRRKYITGRHE